MYLLIHLIRRITNQENSSLKNMEQIITFDCVKH